MVTVFSLVEIVRLQGEEVSSRVIHVVRVDSRSSLSLVFMMISLLLRYVKESTTCFAFEIESLDVTHSITKRF